MGTKENRRSPRIEARMWIQVAGVDSSPQLRRGNINKNGIFFEMEEAVGEPDSVQTLIVSPYDKSRSVQIMARLDRVVRRQDLWSGFRMAGAAFEFMFEDTAKRVHVAQVVDEIAARTKANRDGEVESRFVIHTLDRTGMHISTGWNVQVGEQIRCRVEVPNDPRRVQLEGEIIDVQSREDGLSEVWVEFPNVSTGPAPEGDSLSDAMDVLLEETAVPQFDASIASRQDHLRGSLTRIPLPGLLTFVEMERLSGSLSITARERGYELTIRDGFLLEAVQDGYPVEPRSALKDLLSWREGEFHFVLGEVDGKLEGEKITAVLLDLVRADDELSR